METILEDLRVGLRTMRSNPTFYLLPILILSLGMGSALMLFSYVNAWIIQPIEYPDPERLVYFESLNKQGGFHDELSAPDFEDIQRQTKLLESIAGYTVISKTLTGDHEPERVTTAEVSAELFQILGVKPLLGSTFVKDHQVPGRDGVMLISHGMWKTRFPGDPGIIGRKVRMDGQPVEVVGVLPEKFHFALMGVANVFVPLVFTKSQRENRNASAVHGIAKLHPGVTVAQAYAELSSIASSLERAYPDSNTNRTVYLTSMAAEFGQQQGNTYLVASFIIVCLVLLIAATNVANLLLSRVISRQREIAVRFAMGATKGRVIRQLLTENIMMVLAAAALSILIATWAKDLTQSMIPEENRAYLPNFGVVTIDGVGVAFTILMAMIVGFGTGLAPAFEGTKLDLNTMLKEGGPNSSESRGRNRLRALLVGGQVALALALVVTTALIVIGLRDFWDSKPGFEIDHLLTMRIAIPAKDYTNARTVQFFEQATQRIAAQTGVKSITVSNSVPYQGVGDANYRIAGQPEPRKGEVPQSALYLVMPNYFETLNIPLIEGRFLGREDGPDAPRRAVINDVIARKRFPGSSPIRQKLRLGKAGAEYEIVGVVKTVTRNVGRASATDEQMYLAFQQDPRRSVCITVRTQGEPLAMASVVRQQILSLDPNQPIYDVDTMENVRFKESAAYRILVRILTVNGFYALLLAVVGIYAVVSYSVSRRIREMGIRSALGASRNQLLELVVGQGLRLTIPGLACGLLLAVGLMRIMKSMMTELKNDDPLVYIGALAILGTSAIVASFVPALRAARVDPLRALRHE